MICPTCNALIHCPACGGDLPNQSAQPLREMSEEAVEAGASALVDSCVAKGHWSHASEESKSIYRKHARAVLTAARSAP